MIVRLTPQVVAELADIAGDFRLTRTAIATVSPSCADALGPAIARLDGFVAALTPPHPRHAATAEDAFATPEQLR